MLTVLAHAGIPPAPHDLWTSWSPDPLLLGGLVVSWAIYRRGWVRIRDRIERWRRPAFLSGLAVVGVALLSPLDAMSQSLASAHMVQHLLLTLVAAPLLVLGAPLDVMLWGLPREPRKSIARRRRRIRAAARVVRHPLVAWFAYVGALWMWHAAVLYEAALRNSFVHALEHTSFLLTAAGIWWLVLRGTRSSEISPGAAILLVFTIGLQGVILSALLTFSGRPWYVAYSETAPLWGMTALADQQLAGVIMWLVGNLAYAATGVWLVARWVLSTERVGATG